MIHSHGIPGSELVPERPHTPTTPPDDYYNVPIDPTELVPEWGEWLMKDQQEQELVPAVEPIDVDAIYESDSEPEELVPTKLPPRQAKAVANEKIDQFRRIFKQDRAAAMPGKNKEQRMKAPRIDSDSDQEELGQYELDRQQRIVRNKKQLEQIMSSDRCEFMSFNEKQQVMSDLGFDAMNISDEN